MGDLLSNLLERNDRIYGLVCRDMTTVDVELMARAGYHFAWIDLERDDVSGGGRSSGADDCPCGNGAARSRT